MEDCLLILQWPVATDKLHVMVRPFALRDLALVRRLSEHGVSLHTESALADDMRPLRAALTNMVVGGNSTTLVFKSEDGEAAGFIQLLFEEDPHHAHILYLSPAIEPHAIEASLEAVPGGLDSSSAWLSLLDKAVAESGKNGVHSLVAEVDEQGAELALLRQAGFAVYTRQDIWLFDGQVDLSASSESRAMLLPYLSSDDWDVQLLYANTVPRLVQLVEPAPPSMTGDGWVLRDEKDELAAFIHVHEGSAATWLRFFFHPSADADVSDIVKALLQQKLNRGKKPVYCCVRRYEGWLPVALENLGFHIWGSQALLVKHTVHHSPRTQPQQAVNIEKSGMQVTSPFIGSFPIQKNQKDNPSIKEKDQRQPDEMKAFA